MDKWGASTEDACDVGLMSHDRGHPNRLLVHGVRHLVCPLQVIRDHGSMHSRAMQNATVVRFGKQPTLANEVTYPNLIFQTEIIHILPVLFANWGTQNPKIIPAYLCKFF